MQDDAQLPVCFWREQIKELQSLTNGDVIDISDISIKIMDDGRRYYNASESTEITIVSTIIHILSTQT